VIDHQRSWRGCLAGAAIPRLLLSPVPLGLPAGGQAAYVSTWQPGFAGVALLDLASGRLRPIQRYRHPAVDQADGAAAGRWLVWEQSHSLQSLDGFTVYAWDSVTGRVRALGHALAAPADLRRPGGQVGAPGAAAARAQPRRRPPVRLRL